MYLPPFDGRPGIEPPVQFGFPKQLHASLTISHELSPSVHRYIPYANPMLIEWPGGSMLEESITSDGYRFSLFHFNILKEITLQPVAMVNFCEMHYTLKGSSHSLLRGHGVNALLPFSYTPLYIPEGRHKMWLRPGEHVFLYIVIDIKHLQFLAGDHPPINTLIQKFLTSSRHGTFMERMPIDDAILRIIKEMQECNKTGAGLSLELQGFVVRLLSAYDEHLRIMNDPNANIGPREMAYRIVDYVTKNYVDPSKVSNDVLSSKFWISISSLERSFKKYTGMTPSEYIREIRLHVAHDMLAIQRLPVQVVSESVGYEHVSSFSREFKKMYGVSPKVSQS